MVKTSVNVFELPQRLGILQYVEYDPSPRECAHDGCLYEGVLIAEGCRKGVCIRYHVKVRSKGKTWETREFRRVRIGDRGGCIPPAVADALWELAGRYDVGVWYEYDFSCLGVIGMCNPVLDKRKCGVIINGVRLPMPYYCTVEECVEQILEYYKREVEKMKEPPKLYINNAEELLKKYPELEAFGAEWVKAWAPHARERLVEIAEVMRRYPWMTDVIKKRPMDSLNPHEITAYVVKDSSLVCLSLNHRTYCAQNGAVKAVKLELEFSRYEVYEGKKWAVYRPKGLLTFTAVGKEYVKIL
jgi:hypothetical protein